MEQSYKQYLQNKNEIDKEIDEIFFHYLPTFEKNIFY